MECLREQSLAGTRFAEQYYRHIARCGAKNQLEGSKKRGGSPNGHAGI